MSILAQETEVKRYFRSGNSQNLFHFTITPDPVYGQNSQLVRTVRLLGALPVHLLFAALVILLKQKEICRRMRNFVFYL
jgi:hypothetical protein